MQKAYSDLWNYGPREEILENGQGHGHSDFCLPLNDQADNLRVNISKEGKNFEMTTHQTLIKHWDGLKDGKLHGGVKNVDSVMIQIYVPDWFKGSKISITDIHTQELIVSGGM